LEARTSGIVEDSIIEGEILPNRNVIRLAVYPLAVASDKHLTCSRMVPQQGGDLKRLLILSMAVALVFSGSALAQQKRTSTARKKTTPAAKPATPDLRAEAGQVTEQLKLLTRFIYVYGKTANGLEMAELQAKQEATSAELQAKLQAKNKQTRSSLVASIGSLKDGIDRVGQRFHDNQYLQIQYLKVLSASEAIASAQQLASDGKFDEAGRTLVAAADRLADAAVATR
jgi:hypothetical protein